MLFAGCGIPAGCTVDAGVFRYIARDTISATQVDVDIYAEDSLTPSAVTGHADGDGKTLTTAKVDWDNIPAETAGNTIDSPEIKTIIQELVDSGLDDGDDVQILVHTTSTDTATRVPSSYDHATNDPPELRTTYTPASTDPEASLIGGKLVGGGVLLGRRLVG